jgi:glycosyltransferase involved in cell wall biosynthesis
VIGLYCPDLPPVPGGVSDHTLVLGRALEAMGHGPAVLGWRGDPELFAPLPCRVGLGPWGVRRVLRERSITALVVQYVPFLFARRGISPALWMALWGLARDRVRIGVVLHEPYVPFTRPSWLLTGWPMRWQLKYLLRRSAFVYAPVPRYVEIARRFAVEAKVKLAPIGATLPVTTMSRDSARLKLGLSSGVVAIGVFSPAASGFNRAWIEEACRRLSGHAHVVWVAFGYGGGQVLRDPPAGLKLIRVHDDDAEVVTRTMRALDIVAAPYVDGLTLRRSGAMLALAHGVATVSSTGPLFDHRLTELAACESTADAFVSRLARLIMNSGERAALAARTAGYRTKASVEVLARMIASDLGGGVRR